MEEKDYNLRAIQTLGGVLYIQGLTEPTKKEIEDKLLDLIKKL